MKSVRMTWPRRGVALLSLAFWALGLVFLLPFLSLISPIWFWTGLILGILGLVILAFRVLGAFTHYFLEEGILRIKRGPWNEYWDLGRLKDLRESPARGVLLLFFEKGRVKIPRRLLGYLHLKEHLPNPHGKELGTPPFRIRAARSPLVFFLVMEGLLAGFFLTVARAVGPGAGWTVLLAGVTLLAGLVLFRVLFFLPLRYDLEPEGIRVRYVLWSRYYPVAASLALVEDLYHADGAPFHLVKMVFRKRNLVLDEFNLLSPLTHLLPWIRENYGPAARGTF